MKNNKKMDWFIKWRLIIWPILIVIISLTTSLLCLFGKMKGESISDSPLHRG